MGYTHYNRGKDITPEVDRLYRELLDTIKTEGGHSLLTIWKSSIGHEIDGELAPSIHGTSFKIYFHEYARGDNGMPRLLNSFTKTARKQYDIAVMLAYTYNAIISGHSPEGDYYEDSCLDIVQAIEEHNVELLSIGLRGYIDNEDIDIDTTQVPAIARKFFEVAEFDGVDPTIKMQKLNLSQN